MENLFEIFLLMHIVAGSIGLTSFWIPIFARKGRGLHSKAGKVFAYAMMATATSAAIVALLTIIDPLATHPTTSSRYAINLRAINGLMLLYLAVLTYGAAFTGLRAVRMKLSRGAHRDALELGIQGAVFLLAAAVLLAAFFGDEDDSDSMAPTLLLVSGCLLAAVSLATLLEALGP